MNKLYVLGLAAAGLLAATGAAQAQKVLRIASWAPPTHQVNSGILPTWGKWIEEASKGRLTTKIEYGLAAPPAMFDLARDGIADIAWGSHGYTPGRFTLTEIVELPGLGTSAEAASVAYWRVHQKYLAKADEHKGMILLGLMSHGPGLVHTKAKLNSLAELKDLKIRIGGGVAAEVGRLLGVVGVQVPAPKVYETLQQGVADGIFMPMEAKKGFKLFEVTPYTLVVPGGLYYNSFGFVMNIDSFKSLSKEDQDAIMSVSGEKLTRMAGMWWDRADEEGRAAAEAGNNTITVADAAAAKGFDDVVARIEAEWLKKAEGRGVDAKAALDELRQIARDYKN